MRPAISLPSARDGVALKFMIFAAGNFAQRVPASSNVMVPLVETLNTIVDASIRELDKLRSASGDGRLKIIASALNFEHCRQIVEAYRSRGQRADYVHSKEDGRAS